VVRGGSWINNQDNARASYRNNNTPDNRNNNIGFRVCCVSHIDPLFFIGAGIFFCASYASLAAYHSFWNCSSTTVCGPKRRAD
jgi:hypothetical protein